MPYKLEKTGSKYYVIDDNGKRYSEKPMPKWRARAQMRALYANEKKEHTGVMICLVPPVEVAKQLTFPVAIGESSPLPLHEIHMTLAFLGDSQSAGIDRQRLDEVITAFAQGHRPFGGAISGAARFAAPESPVTPIVALVDSPLLPDFRQDLIAALQDANIPVVLNHGFTPHITMAYVPVDEPVTINKPPDGTVFFDTVWVAWGDEWQPYLLTGYKSASDHQGFRVFKQADGSYRWVTFSSSAFRDRDGEVVTAKALEDAVNRMDESGNHGPLRWWHVGAWEYPDGPESWQTWTAGKGVDLGTCDFSMVHGRMLVESGTFKDAPTGKAFSQAADNLEVSIAFSHPPDEPGESKEFSNIHIFERSLLPAGMASNLLTRFYVNKEGETMKAAQKLQALAAILRDKPDVVKQILADAESVEKAAETAGLEFKEVAAMLEGTASDTEETASTTEEVIQSPEPAAEPPAPEPAAKQAPEAEEEDMIGEMSHDDLVGLIRQVVAEVITASAEQGKAKEQANAQLVADLAAAQKGVLDRLDRVEQTATQTKQDLLELTDARPAGVKQLHTQRATERQDNVVKNAPTGPTIDPEFLRFATGGK